MVAQVFKKGRYILLRRRQQYPVATFDELGKGFQVAVIGLAGKRTKSLLNAQIRLVILQERKIARAVHTSDYERPQPILPPPGSSPYLVHQGINFINTVSFRISILDIFNGL